MASLNSDDCLLVGRDGVDYKVHYEDFVESLEGDLNIDASGGSVSWNDLTDKPAIPSPANNGKLVFKRADNSVIDDLFSADSSYDVGVKLPYLERAEIEADFMPLDLRTLPPLN